MVQAALKGAAKGVGYQLTYRVVWPDGSVRTVLETPSRPRVASSLLLEGSVQDITEQVDTQRRIRQLAYFDPSPGSPNREFFRESLLSAVPAACATTPPARVMVLDIDHFARINDSLGPERGDQVLQVIGHRLRETHGRPHAGRARRRRQPAATSRWRASPPTSSAVLISDVGPVEEVIEVATACSRWCGRRSACRGRRSPRRGVGWR